jgi:phosphate transport system substrate-binding protein
VKRWDLGCARALLLGLGFGLLSLGSGCSSGAGGAPRLDGAGSTFVDPMMQEWAGLYVREKGVQVNYQGKGSGAGIKMMTDREVNFGCTDAPLTDEQLAKAGEVGGEVVFIPVVMGGVVPVYNLPGQPDLRFTGEVLAKIYRKEVSNWNDPALKELNPQVDLPDLPIAVVHRSDSSGTSYIWTEYLSKVDKNWTSVGTALSWPTGIGQKGTDGVAGYVKNNPGAIGYVELTYALQNKIQYGAVRNRDGEYVRADSQSVTLAAESALKEVQPDLRRLPLTNVAGKGAYPIAGTTWAILYANQPPDKARLVADFLRWVTHEGQGSTREMNYAPLPEGLVRLIDVQLQRIRAAQ